MNARQARDVLKVLCKGLRKPVPSDGQSIAYVAKLKRYDLDEALLAVQRWLRERPHEMPTVDQLGVALSTEHALLRGQRELVAGAPLDEYRETGLAGIARARAALRASTKNRAA